MRVFKKVDDIQEFIANARGNKQIIGFVPTMGALHEGHLSLITECLKTCDITISSIFVNPTQFNNPEDLKKYPRTIETDIEKLAAAGCDVLFYPDVDEIYPDAGSIEKQYELGAIETVFEGASRPGHFQGVCKVLDRLFTIVQPDHIFFGQKDYQQCMVVNRLLQLIPAFSNIQMHIVPTMREASGLAMSSRNMRLDATALAKAPALYAALQYLKNNRVPGDTIPLTNEAEKQIAAAGFVTDYIALANAETLEPVPYWDGHTPLVALAAAYLGSIRLIDNLVM